VACVVSGGEVRYSQRHGDPEIQVPAADPARTLCRGRLGLASLGKIWKIGVKREEEKGMRG
jgi:hypothetical protein